MHRLIRHSGGNLARLRNRTLETGETMVTGLGTHAHMGRQRHHLQTVTDQLVVTA